MKLPGLQEGAGGGIVARDGNYVPDETVDVLGDVAVERRRQNEKWGEQNHGATVWLTILVEEVGELSRAILEDRVLGARRLPGEWPTKLRKEAIESAAVAVAIVEWLDRGSPIDGTDADYRGPR